jgi:hypothetical protein
MSFLSVAADLSTIHLELAPWHVAIVLLVGISGLLHSARLGAEILLVILRHMRRQWHELIRILHLVSGEWKAWKRPPRGRRRNRTIQT